MTVERTVSDPLVHRALGSAVRVRLLGYLRVEPDLDVVGLGERLGLHVNTVRSHLAVLEEAGLVASVKEDRSRPGRPRLRYRATPAVADEPSRDERAYRFLAGILAGYLDATTADTASAAEDAGTAWGRYVVDRPAPYVQVDADEAVERVRRVMDEFGFAPEVDASDPAAPRLVLHRCPFVELAREHQDVICSVHLGLLRGALAELGAPVGADNLVPWATPRTCVAHLRTAAG